jgi:hypothetical protein
MRTDRAVPSRVEELMHVRGRFEDARHFPAGRHEGGR